MNAARMGVLILAVIAAGLAALLARGLVSSGQAPTQTETAQVQTSEVLVAATNVERGARLSAADLRWQPWPTSSLAPGFLTRQQKSDAITSLAGSLVRTSMASGEPVTESKLIDMKTGGFMSALIDPGMRAVAVTVSPETGAGGFILPNDRVDVIQTRRAQEEGPRGPQDVVRGEIILHDIRVLAIDQRFKDDAGEQVALGKTATLELTPAQAKLISVAQAEGALVLSLRGLAGPTQETSDAPAEATTSVLHIVRYGAAQSVRVR